MCIWVCLRRLGSTLTPPLRRHFVPHRWQVWWHCTSLSPSLLRHVTVVVNWPVPLQTMWSFPPFRGVLVCVSVELVTKLLLGKKTFNPPSSFKIERPSMNVIGSNQDTHAHYINYTNNRGCPNPHLIPAAEPQWLPASINFLDPSGVDMSNVHRASFVNPTPTKKGFNVKIPIYNSTIICLHVCYIGINLMHSKSNFIGFLA